MTATPQLETLVVTFPLGEESLDKLRKSFKTVLYRPDDEIKPEEAREVDVWMARHTGIPKDLEYEDLARTKLVQLTSAGANLAVKHPALQSDEAKKRIAVCSASGIHVLTIPGYIVSQVLGIYSNIHTSVHITRSEGRWPKREEMRYRPKAGVEVPFGTQGLYTLRGKTAGLLGYGHIGRETARLLYAFGVTILAANSNGEKREDDGYIIPGTGDKDGSIPEAYYSTTDEKSFNTFLSRCDILIASLPSTPATRYMLTKEHFAALPKDAIFINVGRGDLVKSEILLEALDKPNGLLAVGLDVTDPEPLPDGHALLTHPRAVITPHMSADFAGYFDAGVDLLIANVERVRNGGEWMNRVDPEKGY